MKTFRTTAIVVGVSFILATVLSLISSTLIEPVTNASNLLASASTHGSQLTIGALSQLAAAVSVALIPAALFPVLKRRNEGAALGYFGFRILEAITLIIGAMSALLLISLGQEYVRAGASTGSYFHTMGAMLLATWNWAFPLDPVVFGPGSLLLNVVLFQSRLIPRWLSAWGIIGAAMVFVLGVIGMFGAILFVLAIPIGVQEMAFALWLIAKGFNPSALASKPS